jgi:hypothetical protein
LLRDLFERRGLPPRRFAFIRLDGSDEQIDASDIIISVIFLYVAVIIRKAEGGIWKL